MESTEERIMHYQRGIERSVAVLDKPRLLHCIKALSKLPVTMKHLKSTGIGRTVNSLRKIDEGVGDASKRLVTKWKEMVSNASDSGESDEACVPDDPDNYESVNYDQDYNSGAEDNAVQSDDYNGVNRPEALDKPELSPPMVIDVNVSPEQPVPNLSDEEEEPEETNIKETSKHPPIKENKESKKDSKSVSSSRNSESKDKKESSKMSKNSKDNGHEEHKRHKDKDRNRSKSDSSSSNKEKKHSSEVKKRKVESSDDESNRKKQRLSLCENDEEEMDNFVINDEENHESSSDEHDDVVKESSKDRHKESSLKHSDSKSKSKEKRSSSNSSSKVKSHESPSSSSSSSKKDKSSDERKKDDKHKSKSSHSSSSGKESNGKDKDKHHSSGSSSSSSSSKDKSKNEEKVKVKDKKEHKKSKEHKEEKKTTKKSAVIESIDSMSGTSFADALGMCSMPPPKKKKESSSKSSKSDQSSPQTSPTKPSSSKYKIEQRSVSPTPDSPEESLDLLSPNVKLEPLTGDINEEVDLASTLPEPSPYYKPLPQVNHVQRRVDEEAMLSQVINAKVQRTKVYSGNKCGWTVVPSLQEICIRLLIENIDALEYTGGVPFDILQPILERANAEQLQRLEYFNPYLMDDTDPMWKFHCNKIFKTKHREEMESWRDMYERCMSEREAKFKAITANIKQSIDKSAPVRSTKLAYVDHFVKPPRNVLRQQAKYGTAKVSTSASDLKKKLIIGAAGPSSSSSSSTNAERISVPPPPPSRIRAPASHPIKKAKAPLMAKALQAIKGRYKR